jgi:signal transduction histidine kinase
VIAAAEPDLPGRYIQILRDYLHEPGEGALCAGYDVARQALDSGHGVLEMAGIHHRALRELRVEGRLSDEVLVQAGGFFTECLSPFEMSHRGAREGTLALRHLNEVLEGEVKRIAHSLHDEAGQLLATIHLALAELAEELPARARERIADIERLLRQIEAGLRGLSHELRPTMLDNLGLLPALEFLAEQVAKRAGFTVSVEADRERRLPPAVETALYRIVQEALTNAAKHARAETVKIELICTPRKVSCSIRDDGMGFVPHSDGAAQGLGLLGIRERLNALGGTLRLVSGPGQGTTILAEIPLGG